MILRRKNQGENAMLIKTHIPNSFSKYPGTRVIIDCTEFFIEQPSSPSAQKATWSDYKHHNTVKLLVGITPSGAFSFISKLCLGTLGIGESLKKVTS